MKSPSQNGTISLWVTEAPVSPIRSFSTFHFFNAVCEYILKNKSQPTLPSDNYTYRRVLFSINYLFSCTNIENYLSL